MSPHAPVARVGQIIASRYRVDEILARGGMGWVVVATDLETGDEVALKIMRREARQHPELVERFLREARIASRVCSEHAVRIHDAGELDDGTVYLVMERLVGGDLATLLGRRGKLAAVETLELALQITRALSAAHEAGVIHRDIKPANLFVTRGDDGRLTVKLLDFGLSKLRSTDSGSASLHSLTGPGVRLGTMQYMAPEQWVCARDVDARADLWAVGVVLFELLTGKSPFTAKSVGVLIEQVFGGSAPRLRELAPTAPAELEALVARCMQRHPSARFESARELADEIEGLLGSLQEAASYAVSAPQADRAGSTPATDTRAHGDETLAVADTEIASARAPERTPTRAPAGGWTAYFGLEASRRRRRDDDATIEAAAQSVRAGARRVWSKAARFALDSPVGGCSSSAAFAM